MLIKRFFQNCSDCRLYKISSKTCKLNRQLAEMNRMDESVCGKQSKHFLLLDKKNLEKSQAFKADSIYCNFFGYVTLPCAFVLDYKIFIVSFTMFVLSENYKSLSEHYLKQYFIENMLDLDDYFKHI